MAWLSFLAGDFCGSTDTKTKLDTLMLSEYQLHSLTQSGNAPKWRGNVPEKNEKEVWEVFLS